MHRLSADVNGYLRIVIYAATPEACIARFREVAEREAKRRKTDWRDSIDMIIARCENGPEGYIEDLTNGAAFVDHERID